MWTLETYGTLKINNPKTLEKWILNGKFKELIDNGYYFGIGCGRFKKTQCICSRCKKNSKKELQEIINKHLKNENTK